MNSHLNIFKAYAKDNREYQLENDLTRAFAICLQEDNLFFHEVLKEIIGKAYYNQFFGSYENEANIEIDIQKGADKINDFEYIFAISLSDNEMSVDNFWEQKNETEYITICDLVMKIDNVLFVFETKRNNVDCTSQLYNQIFNISKHNNDFEFNKQNVTPFDLNWRKLMQIATRVYSVQKSTNQVNRFLSDFIDFIKIHNFTWLPESCLASLSSVNHSAIYRRIKTAITLLAKEEKSKISLLDYRDRLGVDFPKPWAKELLFSIIKEKGDLVVSICPGNTKGQGIELFSKTPKFNNKIILRGEVFNYYHYYHIKFTSFQKYFTGLWFGDDKLKTNIDQLYNNDNFWKYTGRNKRGQHWNNIENLFDQHFNYDWREQCDWNGIINSGKNQFDMSFGYVIELIIPFKKLQELDKDPNNLEGLKDLINDIYHSLSNDLLMS